MIVTHSLKMDMARPGGVQQLSVVQDDKYSRNLAIALYADGEPWAPGDNIRAIVRFVKKDGAGGSYDTLPDMTPAYSVARNVVTVALAPQVCTAPGWVRLAVSLTKELVIAGGGAETATISTFTIDLNVRPNPGLLAVSEGYYNVRGALPDSGWAPNMYLGTNDNGDVVVKEVPVSNSGGGLELVELTTTLTLEFDTDQPLNEADAAIMQAAAEKRLPIIIACTIDWGDDSDLLAYNRCVADYANAAETFAFIGNFQLVGCRLFVTNFGSGWVAQLTA